MPIEQFEGQEGYLMPWRMDENLNMVIRTIWFDVPMSLGSDLVKTAGQGEVNYKDPTSGRNSKTSIW